MNKVQKHSLQLLVEFDAFCKQNDIQYFLAWGTLLGAVRHKGFIPWDDDIDLGMDMKNWAKFREMVNQGKLPSHMRFEDMGFIPGAIVPKIRDLRESVVVDHTGRQGYFLDIFPFRRYTLLEKLVIQFCLSGNHLRTKRKKIKNPIARSVFAFISLLPNEISNLLKKTILPLIAQRRESINGEYFAKDVLLLPKVWFKYEDCYPLIQMPFEGKEFSVPHNWDTVLGETYGDYMIPIDQHRNHYHHDE